MSLLVTPRTAAVAERHRPRRHPRDMNHGYTASTQVRLNSNNAITFGLQVHASVKKASVTKVVSVPEMSICVWTIIVQSVKRVLTSYVEMRMVSHPV